MLMTIYKLSNPSEGHSLEMDTIKSFNSNTTLYSSTIWAVYQLMKMDNLNHTRTKHSRSSTLRKPTPVNTSSAAGVMVENAHHANINMESKRSFRRS